jgi:Lon protease-like protein
MMNFIPIFPLSIVVFPGENLNLHIFEPRYRELIRECSDSGKPFGIPVVMDNRLRELGTLVEVTEISRTYEDGKMDIRCRGISVFRMMEFIAEVPDKLYSGAIVDYPPNDLTARPRLIRKVRDGLLQLHTMLSISKPLPDKGDDLLSYDLAHHLGLPQAAEYELLAHFDERQRLELLRRHLQRALPIVSGMEALKERVKLNGHFRDLSGMDFNINWKKD